MSEIRYIVLCGKNGKQYVYKDYERAHKLYLKLLNENYYTEIIETTKNRISAVLSK